MFQFIIHVLTETSVILSYTRTKQWSLLGIGSFTPNMLPILIEKEQLPSLCTHLVVFLKFFTYMLLSRPKG